SRAGACQSLESGRASLHVRRHEAWIADENRARAESCLSPHLPPACNRSAVQRSMQGPPKRAPLRQKDLLVSLFRSWFTAPRTKTLEQIESDVDRAPTEQTRKHSSNWDCHWSNRYRQAQHSGRVRWRHFPRCCWDC